MESGVECARTALRLQMASALFQGVFGEFRRADGDRERLKGADGAWRMTGITDAASVTFLTRVSGSGAMGAQSESWRTRAGALPQSGAGAAIERGVHGAVHGVVHAAAVRVFRPTLMHDAAPMPVRSETRAARIGAVAKADTGIGTGAAETVPGVVSFARRVLPRTCWLEAQWRGRGSSRGEALPRSR